MTTKVEHRPRGLPRRRRKHGQVSVDDDHVDSDGDNDNKVDTTRNAVRRRSHHDHSKSWIDDHVDIHGDADNKMSRKTNEKKMTTTTSATAHLRHVMNVALGGVQPDVQTCYINLL